MMIYKPFSAVSLSELSQLCYSYLMPACHGSSQTPLSIMTLCLLKTSLTSIQNTEKLKLHKNAQWSIQMFLLKLQYLIHTWFVCRQRDFSIGSAPSVEECVCKVSRLLFV